MTQFPSVVILYRQALWWIVGPCFSSTPHGPAWRKVCFGQRRLRGGRGCLRVIIPLLKAGWRSPFRQKDMQRKRVLAKAQESLSQTWRGEGHFFCLRETSASPTTSCSVVGERTLFFFSFFPPRGEDSRPSFLIEKSVQAPSKDHSG